MAPSLRTHKDGATTVNGAAQFSETRIERTWKKGDDAVGILVDDHYLPGDRVAGTLQAAIGVGSAGERDRRMTCPQAITGNPGITQPWPLSVVTNEIGVMTVPLIAYAGSGATSWLSMTPSSAVGLSEHASMPAHAARSVNMIEDAFIPTSTQVIDHLQWA